MNSEPTHRQRSGTAAVIERWGDRSYLPLMVNLVLISAVVAIDWITPAGIVVGILLMVPIMLSAIWDDRRRTIWLTLLFSIAGFFLAALFGMGGAAPPSIWLPNRIIVVLMLVGTAALAHLVQQNRVDALQSRDAAVAAKDLNRLLMSLLAHDLRAPLTVASQGFKYVEEALGDGRPIDRLLLSDVRARLRRSLRAIDIVLSLARQELPREGGVPAARSQESLRIDGELGAEIESFEEEAAARGKVLHADLAAVEGRSCVVDGLVLRQVIAILLDNAVRHALPGPVTVSAELKHPSLLVRVQDSGPGLSAHRARGSSSSSGMGMGLELCRTLVARAGGALDVERDGADGTCFRLQLPARLLRKTNDGETQELALRSEADRPPVGSH